MSTGSGPDAATRAEARRQLREAWLMVLGLGIAIIAVGTGHCLVMSPLYAIMQQIIYGYRNQIEIPVAISIYRFVDRIGLVIGPLLAALLVQQMSYPGAMATIGGLVILAVLLTLVAVNADRRRVPGGVTA